MSPVAVEHHVQATIRGGGGESNANPRVSPELTGVDEPRDVTVAMELDAGHSSFSDEPFSMMLLNDHGLAKFGSVD
jgi:hypothetical protein